MLFADELLRTNPFAFADALLGKASSYTWQVNPDLTPSGTCKECEALDGEVFDGNQVPDRPHPFCACSIIDDDTGEEVDDIELMIRAELWKYNQVHDEHGRFGFSSGDGIKATLGAAQAVSKMPSGASPQGIMNSKAQSLIYQGVVLTSPPHSNDGGISDSLEPSQLKNEVVTALSARSGLSYDRTNELVATWAASSSDTQPDSIALQQAAHDVFGVEMTPFMQQQADAMSQNGTDFTVNNPYAGVVGAQWDARVSDATTFVKGMYSYTQETLAAQGISSLTLYRGVGFESTAPSDSPLTVGVASAAFDTNAAYAAQYAAAAASPEPDTLDQNPIGAWSLSLTTASSFALSQNNGGGSFVMTTQVPASRILSLAATGIGCQDESEATVLGGRGSSFGTVSTTQLPSTRDVAPQAGMDIEQMIAAAGGA